MMWAEVDLVALALKYHIIRSDFRIKYGRTIWKWYSIRYADDNLSLLFYDKEIKCNVG